jgi:hypothetical protein
MGRFELSGSRKSLGVNLGVKIFDGFLQTVYISFIDGKAAFGPVAQLGERILGKVKLMYLHICDAFSA